jgi:deoxyribose-phosphate aldolase
MVGDYETAAEEIRACRKAVDAAGERVGRKVVLKVIIESGVLSTPERIADASFLAMEAGADFIKTSTGKVEVNATPMAAYVMCECIRKFYEKTGRKVGFKAAGGVSTVMDAVCYYSIVSAILGKEWLNKDLFRFGVSRLANSLISAIEQKTVTFF